MPRWAAALERVRQGVGARGRPYHDPSEPHGPLLGGGRLHRRVRALGNQQVGPHTHGNEWRLRRHRSI
eukprot:7096147-Pyramimonas_sp.AAC.1